MAAASATTSAAAAAAAAAHRRLLQPCLSCSLLCTGGIIVLGALGALTNDSDVSPLFPAYRELLPLPCRCARPYCLQIAPGCPLLRRMVAPPIFPPVDSSIQQLPPFRCAEAALQATDWYAALATARHPTYTAAPTHIAPAQGWLGLVGAWRLQRCSSPCTPWLSVRQMIPSNTCWAVLLHVCCPAHSLCVATQPLVAFLGSTSADMPAFHSPTSLLPHPGFRPLPQLARHPDVLLRHCIRCPHPPDQRVSAAGCWNGGRIWRSTAAAQQPCWAARTGPLLGSPSLSSEHPAYHRCLVYHAAFTTHSPASRLQRDGEQGSPARLQWL